MHGRCFCAAVPLFLNQELLVPQDTGLVIEAMGGWAGRHQNVRGKGVALLDRVDGQVVQLALKSVSWCLR